jgi:tellurite resistance protein
MQRDKEGIMSGYHTALIYAMVLTSASDSNMTEAELTTIRRTVETLPVFRDFDVQGLPEASGSCVSLLEGEDGLEHVLDFIKVGLPSHLYETAYAIACEVAAADGHAEQEELRFLEMLRHHLHIDRLIAAGIERGVRARNMVR